MGWEEEDWKGGKKKNRQINYKTSAAAWGWRVEERRGKDNFI